MVEVSNKFGNGFKLSVFFFVVVVVFPWVYKTFFISWTRALFSEMVGLFVSAVLVPCILGFGLSYLLIPNDNNKYNKVINYIFIAAIVVFVIYVISFLF